MPNWKKVVVSGSGISQLTNDANYLAQSDAAAQLTGSFTGSFSGDGSQLTGVSNYTDSDTLNYINTKNVVSGSSQVSISSTDGFAVFSGSVKSYADGINSDLSSSVGSIVNPLDNRIDSLENFSSSLDATFATEAEVNSSVTGLSGSAHVQREAIKSSLNTSIGTNTSAISSLSSSADSQRKAIKSGLDSDITSAVSTLSSSAEVKREAIRTGLNNNIGSLSGSAHSQRKAIESSLDGKIGVEKDRVDAILSASVADTDTFAEIVSLINSVDTENDQAFAGYVTSSNARQTNIETSVTTLSGSAEVARQSIKSGLASDISTVDGKANTNASNISTNVSNIATNASGISSNASAITALSSSAEIKREAIKAGLVSVQEDQDGRLGSIEAFTASLNSTFATDAEVASAVSTLSGSAHSQREAIKGALASDISTNASNIASNGTAITTLSGSAHTQREALDSAQSSAVSSLSSSADGQRKAIESSLDGKIGTEKGRIDAILSASVADTDTFAEIVTLINSVDTENDQAFAGYVTSSNARQTNIESSVTSLSGSAHIQREALKSGLAGDISTVDGKANTNASNIASNVSNIATNANNIGTNSAAITSLSGSAHTQRVALNSSIASEQGVQDGRINALEIFTASLDSTFATDSEVSSAISTLSGSADGQRKVIKSELAGDISTNASAITALSSSAEVKREAIKGALASDISTNAGNISTNAGNISTNASGITALSSSADVQRKALNSAQSSALSSLSSSAEVKREAIKSELSSAYASADTALSSSAHSQRKAIESSLDGKIGTEKDRIDAILSASVADTDTFAEIVDLINNVDTSNDQAFAGYVTSSNARQTNIESSVTSLSSSAAIANASIASDVSTNAGNISSNASAITALSSSAEIKREAIKGALTSLISANTSAISGLDSTYATDVALSNTSASFATTIDGLTSDYTELTNIPAGIISSSAQQVAGLVNQQVNLGTGAITASYFKGDGSFLENVTVAQSATVVRDFTNVTSYVVNHNFGDKNILVTVYDANDYQIFPASIQVFDNTAEIRFDEGTTGKVIVGKGGHVVSGSIEFGNIINKPSLVSSSAQVASLFGVTGVSASIDSRIDALSSTVSNLDGNYATDAELAAVSSSFATTVGAISTDFANIQNKPSLVSGSGQVDITATDGYTALTGTITAAASATTALSSSAEVKREAIKTSLASDIATANTAVSTLSGSAHTQREALASGLDGKIGTEKGRIDAILAAASADTDTFAEIVSLINSVDTTNDQAFAGFVTSSNAAQGVQDGRLDSIESFTASIDAAYASEGQLTSLSSSAEVKREAIKTSLASDISTVDGKVTTNTSGIATNVSNIATNASGISSNVSNIATNASGIATNVGNISSNLGKINTNISNIAANVSSISALSSSAEVKREAIKSALAADIASNTSAISNLDNTYASDAALSSLSGSAHISRQSQSQASALNVSNLSGSAHTQREAIKGALATDISSNAGSISTNASGISTNVSNISSNLGKINTNTGNIATNASSITSLSSSAEVKREAIRTGLNSSIGSLSGSAHTQREALDSAQSSALSSAVSTLSGSAHTANAAVKSELNSSITSLSGSAEVARQAIVSAQSSAYIAADGVLSGSAHTQRKAIESSLDGKIGTEKGRIDAILSASVADTDTFAEIVTLINSVDTENDTAFAGYVTSSNTRQTAIESSVTSLSGSAHSQREAIKSSLQGAVNSNASSITSLSGSAHIQRAALDSAQSSALSSGISSLSSSAEIKREAIKSGLTSDINSSVSGLSGSAHVQRKAIESSLAGSISSANSAVTTLSGSAHTQREAIKSAINGTVSTNTSNIAANLSKANTNASNIASNVSNIATNASGIATNVSNIATNANNIGTNASSITSLSGSAHTHRVALDSSIATEQSVQDGRINALEVFTASLDSSFATDAEVSSAVSVLSGSAEVKREAIKASLAGDISTVDGKANTNASNISTNASGIATNVSNISSNASSITSLSGSAHVQRKAIESGLNTTISNLSSTLNVVGNSGTDSVNLKDDSLSIVGTAGEISTTVTNNQIAVGIVDNATLTGNVTITGNLNVTGDTIQAQVANLNVEDRFILLNSGSATGDAGIIFGGSDGVVNVGSGIFWDSPSNVFGFADGIAADATTATHSSKLGNIQEASSSPTTAPDFQGKGSIHIDTSNEEIWIYS